MATFTAAKAVNLVTLPELLALDGGSQISPLVNPPDAYQPAVIIEENEDTNTAIFLYGTSFGVDPLNLSGTVLALDTYTSQTRAFSITEIALDFVNDIRAVEAGEPATLQTLLDKIFAGSDTIIGSVQTDTLAGRAGNDVINGRAGDDTLVGGLGKDHLTGGAGADRFDFNAIAESRGANSDTLAGFSSAQHDRIDLRDIPIAAGNSQVFTFIGTQTFAAYHASHPNIFGMVRATAGLVQANVDATFAADFQIHLTGAVTLTAHDFLL